MKVAMRSFLLIALFAFSAVVGVVGQCTYDPSPARDFANGRVIKYDTSDKNPGGAHGAGGRSLKGGFCIDAKDNAQKCQGQAAEVVGLYECSNGQLCCPETYRNSMPVPMGKHAPGTCGLNKKDKNGRFMIGKCASDKWGTCDDVGAIEALDAMDNCGPGMRQCCEYLKGEFEAEQSKIRAAAAERRAAEQAAAAKAAAEQKAAAQQAAAAEAARQKAADEAAVAAARSRTPEAPVGCNFASNGGRSFYQGTCVRSKVECPGGLADPNNMSAGSSTCTNKFGSGAVCCKTGARLGGAEEAENKVVKDREAAETKAQMDKWRAEQETRASVKSNLEKAEDEARQIASRAGGGAIACVGWKNAGANAVPGTCVASASACPSGNYVTSGSITDYAITCGKLAAGGGQPVCCGGGGAASAATPPVKVGASAPPSEAAPSPAAAAAPSSPSSSSSSGSSSCTYNRGGRSVSGYCAPASWLCPSETNYGSSTSCQGSSVCCGPAPTSSGDLAQTVCPIPSYSSSSAFVEEEIYIQPTPRFSRRRLALQATPKTKSAKSKSKTNDKFTHCFDAKTKKVRTCAKNETPNAVDPKVTAAAAKKIADAKKAAATKKAKATVDKKAAQQKAAQAKKANAAKQKKANASKQKKANAAKPKKANAGKKAGQQKKSAANKSKKDNAGKKAKTPPKKKTNSTKSNKSANSKSNKNGANKKSKNGLPKNAKAKAKAPSKTKTKKTNAKKAASNKAKKATSNKSKKAPASKKKLNSAKSGKKDAKLKGANKKKTGKSTTDKSKNKTKTQKSKNKTKADKKVGASDKTKAKKSGKKAGTNKGKGKSSAKNGKSSKKTTKKNSSAKKDSKKDKAGGNKKAKGKTAGDKKTKGDKKLNAKSKESKPNKSKDAKSKAGKGKGKLGKENKAKDNSKSKSKKTNDKSKDGSGKQTPLKQCAKGAAGKACREENKKITAANKAAKAAGGDPKKTSADAKKSDANAKETSAASAGDPTKLTPKQKAHCNAERRAWLASKARKGDQKAIAQLKKESKKKFFY